MNTAIITEKVDVDLECETTHLGRINTDELPGMAHVYTFLEEDPELDCRDNIQSRIMELLKMHRGKSFSSLFIMAKCVKGKKSRQGWDLTQEIIDWGVNSGLIEKVDNDFSWEYRLMEIKAPVVEKEEFKAWLPTRWR